MNCPTLVVFICAAPWLCSRPNCSSTWAAWNRSTMGSSRTTRRPSPWLSAIWLNCMLSRSHFGSCYTVHVIYALLLYKAGWRESTPLFTLPHWLVLQGLYAAVSDILQHLKDQFPAHTQHAKVCPLTRQSFLHKSSPAFSSFLLSNAALDAVWPKNPVSEAHDWGAIQFGRATGPFHFCVKQNRGPLQVIWRHAWSYCSQVEFKCCIRCQESTSFKSSPSNHWGLQHLAATASALWEDQMHRDDHQVERCCCHITNNIPKLN